MLNERGSIAMSIHNITHINPIATCRWRGRCSASYHAHLRNQHPEYYEREIVNLRPDTDSGEFPAHIYCGEDKGTGMVEEWQDL
jgi:hypothetical protein